MRGHVGAEEVEGHGRERNVSAKRCMYRRRYVRMCALPGICNGTCTRVVRCALI